jgi:signal transduction histidine kinase
VSLFFYQNTKAQNFILRGKVVRPDYTPVKEINVFIENYAPVPTDANGEFSISISKENTKPRNIRIENKEGLVYRTHNYRAENIPLEIMVDIQIKIIGQVVYRNSKGVIHGSIALKNVPVKDSIYTDKLGYFKMTLPIGLTINALVNSSTFVISGKEIRKENVRLLPPNNFVQIRLVEDQPLTLFTVAVYDKNKNKLNGAKLSIDGDAYNIDNQGFLKINKPDLENSVFEVEGFKIINKELSEKDNFMEIFVERVANTLPPPANKNSKDSTTLQQNPKNSKDSTSSRSKYTEEISAIAADMESSGKLLEEKNRKISDNLERLSAKVSNDTSMSPEQMNLIKKDIATLERTFVENDNAYRRSKEQTENLLSRLKEAIFQKDSLNKSITIIQAEQDSLKLQNEKIRDEQKKEAEAFRVRLIAISSFAMMLTILLLVVYIFSNRINKQKKEVEKTKNQLVEKVQEIELKNTQLNLTLEELKKAQAQLVSSEKMASLGQLTAGIAHEINNPVNFTYAGALSLKTDFNELIQLLEQYRLVTLENVTTALPLAKDMEKKVAYPEIRYEIDELLVSVKRGAERTAEIVKSLRTFARLDEDTLKKADIEENLDATLVMLNSQYKERIEIVKKYGKVPQIECFPGQLNQVFMNILLNAIQAIEGSGKIYISTSYPAAHANGKYKEAVEISIRDTGTGMSEEVKQNIFEPFFTTKDVGMGSGLGLSVSFGIIEKHKGEIKVFSELGKGSEFAIILPLNSLQINTSNQQYLVSQKNANKILS